MNGNSKLMIIGAGGHGRVVRDTASLCGYSEISFLDDRLVDETCKVNICGGISDYAQYLSDHDFFVAIGDGTARRKIFTMLSQAGASIAVLIHPSASIGGDVTVGRGSVVMAGAVITNSAVIGEGVIVNTCASVDHDCTLGDFVHISVGAHLCGSVNVGQDVFIGAGSTVINNIDICPSAVLGAGSVVVKSITEAGTYIGVPARKVKSE